MKLYKLSIMALALAGVMVSCNDDKEVPYVAAPQSPGFYFPTSPSNVIELKDGSNTVDIPVYRTDKTTASSVDVTMQFDEEGIFSYSPNVNFAGDALTANAVITYDASKIEYDTYYKVTLTLPSDQATAYGKSTTEVYLSLKSPIEVDWSSTGTWYYNTLANILVGWSEDDPGLPIDRSYSTKNPSVKTYTIHHWCNDVDLPVVMDENNLDEYGYVICNVPETFTGVTVSGYGEMYIADFYNYTGDEQYADFSYYVPETGTFYLAVVYYCEEGPFGNGYEIFQLDGFPDYSVEVQYLGTFTNADASETYAIGNVSVGPDVERALVANIPGTEVNDYLRDIINGDYESTTLGPGNNQTVKFEISGPGEYSMVAISMSADGPETYSSTTYEVVGGGVPDQGNWETIGYAPYCDGWVLPGFNAGGQAINPFDFVEAFYVEVQQNLDNEDEMRLVNPYKTPILEGVNQANGKANIVINIADPDMCYIVPQYSGFSLSMDFGDKWYVGDYAGLLVSVGADLYEDALLDENGEPMDMSIAEYLTDQEANTVYDGSTITVNLPFFGGEDADDFGYIWPMYGRELYPVEIDLSSMEETMPDFAPVRHTMKKAPRLQLSKGVESKSTAYKAIRRTVKNMPQNLKANPAKGVMKVIPPKHLKK